MKRIDTTSLQPYVAPTGETEDESYDVDLSDLQAPQVAGDSYQVKPRGGPQLRDIKEIFDGLKTVGGGPAKSRILSSNVESWNARWDEMLSAKHSIRASYFSFERDVYGMAYLGLALSKLRGGMKTFDLLTDAMADNVGQRGFTKTSKGQDYFQEVVGAGGRIGVFNPLLKRPLKWNAGALASVHDKIQVVDDRSGITGGRNIGREYLTSEKDMPYAWRDMDVVIRGEGPAKGLSEAISRELDRKEFVTYMKPELLGNWVRRDIELIGAYLMMNLTLTDPALSEADKEKLRKDPVAQQARANDLVQRAVAGLENEGITRKPNKREMTKLNEMALELAKYTELQGSRQAYLQSGTWHDGEVKIVDQVAQSKGKRLNEFVQLKPLFENAKSRIIIENPYVVMTEEMIEMLTDAAKRGVEIKIYTNSPLSTDSAVTQAFFLRDWPLILARIPTAKIFVATGERKFHTKSLQIDDEMPLIASYNADILSGQLNSEVGAVMHSASAAKELTSYFEADYADPKNGFLEYTIKRNEDGSAALVDGEPQIAFGPDDHLSDEILLAYKKKCDAVDFMRNRVPMLKPLLHPRKLT